MVQRLKIEQCCGILVDVQEYFLPPLDSAARERILTTSAQFLGLLSHLSVPVLATVERPVEKKGGLPEVLQEHWRAGALLQLREKDYFDLSREAPIEAYLRSLGRRQLVLAGCETDVCVLQSCLGLLEKGYEVFVVEDLVFSSSVATASALHRMREAGAVLLSYKTLFHELLQAVEGSAPRIAIAGTEFPRAIDAFPFA